ncbi:hypothetical protein GGP41_010012 [Bipolaris sorokiniana]|uniref:Uncharacterized protein n=2 Tax=Cochliobolus sativus TaxID=45130 RepID=A0A8H5ZEH3_COCSA|nr:uncharacterized protein COCSADRAFT_29376 [Bipolaris sorokiniana ND90Pr]EMD61104.1 hypothetical protein COCSADRAFT_29376 [Bipolaris sorokiniana ND90Pr]KAF5848873.1 hypothetical protein GGP41_010012 [Bipolaris sorokiniana]
MSSFLSILEEARGEALDSHKATPESTTPKRNIVRLKKGVPRTQKNMRRKDGCDTDFGHSSKSVIPPTSCSDNNKEQLKGQKRLPLVNQKDKMLTKRRRIPSSDKISGGKAGKEQKPSSTTSASHVIKVKPKTVAVSRATQNPDHDTKGQDSEDDFVVDDMAYKPRKSKVGAMARSKLFAGMK